MVDKHLTEGVESQLFTQRERHLIELYISEVNALSQITAERKYSLVVALTHMRKYIADYHTCTTPEVFLSIERYRSSGKHMESSQRIYLSAYKRFLLWLVESGYNKTIDANKITKLSLKIPPSLKTADDILTPEELQNILQATTSVRDRALLEVLYESMGRINEVATLTGGQITFHDVYATVEVESKTGTPRRVPLYTSQIALKRWMTVYPNKITPDNYVFTNSRTSNNMPIKYCNTKKIISSSLV